MSVGYNDEAMSSDPKDSGFEEEPPTLVTCLACGGEWQRDHDAASTYQHITCPWCTQGSMSTDQVAAWKAWRERNKSQP